MAQVTKKEKCREKTSRGRGWGGENRYLDRRGRRRECRTCHKRWSTCFADFSRRSTFKSARSMRHRISSRGLLECETGRQFMISSVRFPRTVAPTKFTYRRDRKVAGSCSEIAEIPREIPSDAWYFPQSWSPDKNSSRLREMQIAFRLKGTQT